MTTVHIVMLGKTTENVIRGIMALGGIEVYPITSETCRDSIGELKKKLSMCTIHEGFDSEEKRSLLIDPFKNDAYEKIIELIIDIVQERKRKKPETVFLVNITGGTNLMSAAASAGAILTNSTAYYVLEGSSDPIILPWHSLESKTVSEKERMILNELKDSNLYGKQLCNRLLANKGIEISTRMMPHYLINLEKIGYVERIRDGRTTLNKLTPWGKIASRLI